MAAYVNAYMTLTDTAQTARLEGWRVEPELFPMLGVQPLYGRVFDTSDAAPGADGVIIVGHAAWQRHLGGRPDVIGRTLTLDNKRYAVIGVMPPGFEFPVEFASRDFWVPLVLDVSTAQARDVRLPTVARLADGVSREQAAAEVGPLLRAMNGKTSAYEFVRVHDEWVGPIRAALRALAVAVVLVFLIAAVNVSSLLLARTATRQREMAIRTALGGGRARLVRLLLTESVLVALAGSAAGVALAFVAVRLLRTLAATMPRMDLGMFTSFPRLGEVVIDLPVLSFTVAVALLTGIVCGLAPAVRHTRPGDADVLRQGVGSTASPARRWYAGARDVLVAAKPQAFIDSRQWPGMAPGFRFLQYYAVRVNTQIDVVTPRIREVVRGLDSDAAVYNLAPMGALLANAVSRPRFYAALGAAFSGIALLIAATGLYGTVAYFVAARTREIGIRVALGARREQVMRLVLYRSVIATGVGIVLGGVGALLVTRYLESLLFGLSPLDPGTFVAVALVFGIVAAIATSVISVTAANLP